MPEEAYSTKKQTKKQEKQTDKLDQLIDKLEERLAILNENELKKLCQKLLVEMNESIQTLYEQHKHLYDLLGLTYGDINYP